MIVALQAETQQRSLVELPELDGEALQAALADCAVRAVMARHRAGLLAHPRAEALAALDAAFRYSHDGPAEAVPPTLGKTLRRCGAPARAREAVVAEVAHLVRTFAALAGDPAPAVRLAAVDAADPAPLADPLPPASRLTLVFALDPPGPEQSPLSGTCLAAGLPAATAVPFPELPAGTAAVLRLAAAEEPCDLPWRGAGGAGRRLVLWLGSPREPRSPRARMPRRRPPQAADVVLASLPFGILDQPSLAIGLLQGALPPGAARCLYFTLPFAQRIGVPLYQWIAEFQPFFTALLGEWLFAAALSPDRGDPRRYLGELLLEPTARWLADPGDEPSFATLVPAGTAAAILRARDAVDGFLDECVDEILAHRPQIVGLTSIFQQHAASLAVARRLKARHPAVTIVVGGSNCEGTMGLATVRGAPWVDAVVSGEGDVVFPLLVERVLAGRSLADLPGVYTRDSAAAVEHSPQPANAPSPNHLDELPVPDFADFFAQLAASGLAPATRPKLILETARGCWWGAKQHCTFCGLNGGTMAFRSKSPQRALDELREMKRRHPGVPMGMADNILDMGYFRTLLPSLAGEGLDLELFYEVKANLKKDELRILRAAGVTAIQPGIESLSDEVLRTMRKGVTGLQNIQLLKWCKELGIWPFWNLLWGFPGEPPEEYARMAELLPRLHHLPPPAGLSPIFLERFSPNFTRSEELGFAAVRPIAVYGHIYPFAAEELADLAYFFHYRHRDGRDVAPYTRPLARQVYDWRESFEESRLVAFDRGDHLMICDTRPMASQSLRFLDGLARDLYLACDGIRTVETLRRLAAEGTGEDVARERIEEILKPLVASGLVVRQGDSVLALAIPGVLGGPAAG